MRLPLAFVLLLAAGCASAPPGARRAAPAADRPSPGEEFEGLPLTVVVERALFDLDSGDPARARRARAALEALPADPVEGSLRGRVQGLPAGSEDRLEALAILASRGDPLEGIAPAERVAMDLREIARASRGGTAALLAVARLQSLGEAGVPLLEAVAAAGAPPDRVRSAEAVLSVLHGLDRRLPRGVP